MLIDWFTVGAQALNFLVLVWLMKRFLYKPVLHAIDEREKRIAAELADAASKKAEAERARKEFQKKQAEADEQRGALLKKATDEAEAERRRLLDAARQAADTLAAKRQAAVVAEAQELRQSVRQRAEQEVFAIARKALADLATTSLEERLGAVFTQRLRQLSVQNKAGLAHALETATPSGPALVRSAFELPAKERATIQNALNETFSADVHVRFETAPALICGIELAAGGLKVGWTIEGYIASLENGVSGLLKERVSAEARPVSKPGANGEPKPEAKAEDVPLRKSAAPEPAAAKP
jgi:F-type H+-transporting ATPase subunit b